MRLLEMKKFELIYILIMGDLNIHLDVLDRADTVKFNSLMTTHGFTQHVQSSTQYSCRWSSARRVPDPSTIDPSCRRIAARWLVRPLDDRRSH